MSINRMEKEVTWIKHGRYGMDIAVVEAIPGESVTLSYKNERFQFFHDDSYPYEPPVVTYRGMDARDDHGGHVQDPARFGQGRHPVISWKEISL